MNQREKILSNKSSNNTCPCLLSQSTEKESDNPKYLVQRINLTSSRPPSIQRINLTGFRSPSASSLQKSNLTSFSPSPLAFLSQKIKLTSSKSLLASSNHLTSFSSSPSASSASSKPFLASSTQKPSINLEKLEAIREKYDIQLPSKYEKDVVTEVLEKREEYRKKTHSDENNYQNLAKELSDLHMKYNHSDNKRLIKRPKFDKKSKKKGKKPLHHADDKDYESSKSSSSTEDPEEMKASNEMKVILKQSSQLTISTTIRCSIVNETFKSGAN
ncbi:602_t:CDS:2 [Funneliformis caledonium]|uniref:602_t:CDS:1 n=1 Tax=Funneliformis caledonium TaxID=1117310 RepID=A0A9N9FWG4_9GLOM|nr:602_t:CDS:2 [Funneliformis caledonium]